VRQKGGLPGPPPRGHVLIVNKLLSLSLPLVHCVAQKRARTHPTCSSDTVPSRAREARARGSAQSLLAYLLRVDREHIPPFFQQAEHVLQRTHSIENGACAPSSGLSLARHGCRWSSRLCQA
jgi:hypothetical protein